MAKFFEELQYLKPLKRLCNFLAFHSGTGWARIRACQASISSSVCFFVSLSVCECVSHSPCLSFYASGCVCICVCVCVCDDCPFLWLLHVFRLQTTNVWPERQVCNIRWTMMAETGRGGVQGGLCATLWCEYPGNSWWMSQQTQRTGAAWRACAIHVGVLLPSCFLNSHNNSSMAVTCHRRYLQRCMRFSPLGV